MPYEGFVNCIRCNKRIDHPAQNNADYVIADDFIVNEKRIKYYAVKNDDTQIALLDMEESRLVDDLKHIEIVEEDTPIQKTGIVCPDCFKDTDFIIWGIHKKEVSLG